jgi:hypothetical protein
VEGAQLSLQHRASKNAGKLVAAGDSCGGPGYAKAAVGLPAREIVQFLASAGYRWFALNQAGDLQPVSSDLSLCDANLVALPRERPEESSTMACLAAAKTT